MFGTASSDGQCISLMIDRGEIRFDPELFDCEALPPGMTHAAATRYIRPLWSAQAAAWLADYGPMPIAYINPNMFEMLPKITTSDDVLHVRAYAQLHRFRVDRRKQVIAAITRNDQNLGLGLEVALDLVLDIERLYLEWKKRTSAANRTHFEQLVESRKIRVSAEDHQIDAILWKRVEPDFAVAAIIVHCWIFTVAIQPQSLTLLITEQLQIQLSFRQPRPQVLFAA